MRIVRKIALDGILVAICGGLYGLVFGGFGTLIHRDLEKLVSIAAYFAGWGLAAGALAGAFGVLFSVDGDPVDPTRSSPNFEKQSHLDAVRHLLVPSHRPAQNSLTSATRTDRKRTQTAGT